MSAIDTIRLNFDSDTLGLLNIILAFVMFGVALGIRVKDFTRILSDPWPVAIGLIAQLALLPALTLGLILLVDPHPGIALGMLLVACCPGGNISNFVTQLARGNAALSVTLTACSTAGAVLILPINFALWTTLLGYTQGAGHAAAPGGRLTLDLFDLFRTVALLLALPLVLGMGTAWRFPGIAVFLRRILRVLSLAFLAILIAGAIYANREYFIEYIDHIAALVFVHNALALLAGYAAARVARLEPFNRRAIVFETGIQNSGLALVLIFDFLDGQGAPALVAAWWGVWHIVAGLSVAGMMRYRDRRLAG